MLDTQVALLRGGTPDAPQSSSAGFGSGLQELAGGERPGNSAALQVLCCTSSFEQGNAP